VDGSGKTHLIYFKGEPKAGELFFTRVEGDSFMFDPRSPYVVFWVIDPDTGAEVPYGARGQVVMNHVSKGMFIPNNLERDTAIRIPGPDGHVGDSVSEVAPVAVFGGEPVIEGVY